MTIKLIMDNVNIPVKHIQFSDGASTVKLDIPEGFKSSRYASITVDPSTPCDKVIQEILLVINAVWCINEDFVGKIILNLPYLPYARGDRKFEEGNPHPLDLFLNVISDLLGKIEVHLTDPHSDYYKTYESELDFVVNPQWDCFIEVAGKDIKSGDVLISPDKGASLKIHQLQYALAIRKIDVSVIEAYKKRDISTGKILETALPEDTDLTGKTVWIVDDLGDYNGTFTRLAQKLKDVGAGEINLYVTHMIAAGGLENIVGLINKLFVYQVVSNYITMEDVRNFNAGKEVRKFTK